MIEMIVTLIIVAIVSVTAIGRLDFASAAGPRSVRDKAVAALQYGRKMAVAQRRHVCVCVGTKANGVCTSGNQILFSIDGQTPETGANFCATSGAGFAEAPLPLPSRDTNCAAGVTNAVCSTGGAAVAAGGGNASLCFDPQGRGLNGTCSAAAARSVTITGADGGVLTVVVELETGYVF